MQMSLILIMLPPLNEYLTGALERASLGLSTTHILNRL